MAPVLPSAAAIKDALFDLYTRSASYLSEDPSIEAAMANSLQKRAGYVNPKEFSKGIIAIFAILGGTMAAVVWWFFMKRGGFVWKEDDWDDYKSSVLRRKGPDGKTISSGSTRAPETVVTDLTYQTEGTETTVVTEKRSERSGRSRQKKAAKPKWEKPAPPKRNNSNRSLGSAFSGMFSRWGRRRDRSPTSTNRDPDLESYADEEPARMKSYNPDPVYVPPPMTESDISEARLDHRGTGYADVGRNPSRYAYKYSEASTSDRSRPLGPRQPTKKSKRENSSSSSRSAAPRRKPTQRAAAQPDLSTITDETESRRMSFEAADDAAFTVYSESISRPTPAHTSQSKRLAGSSSRAKRYADPLKPRASTRHHPRSQFSSSSRTGRKESAGTYRTASTDSSDSECPSDCSCCTTDSESDSEDDLSTNVSTQFRESARGDLGTKVYHHPLGLGINPKRISSPVPRGEISMGKQRGKQPAGERRVVAARSYRQESRGSLSSDSEGDSGNETVTSRVKKALNGQR